MYKYLNIILEKTEELHKNSFNTEDLRNRFKNLDKNKKIYFNKRIEEEFFKDTSFKDCFVDDVFKKIYDIFDEIEK